MIGDLGAARTAASLGARRVYLIEPTEQLAAGGRDARLQAYEQALTESGSTVALMARSDDGSEIGPRLAARIGGVCIQDCTALGTDGGELLAQRPVYGGSAMARVAIPMGEAAVVIMRAGTVTPPEPDPDRCAEVIAVDAEIDPERIRVRTIRTVREAAEGASLEDASVVIAGGRGIGGPEGFDELEELADVLGGAVGASRPACDAGWIDHSRQIGLTGRAVAPELYIAFGISGASQHMAGCGGARCVVAVNNDELASIFRDASYGVVGDWRAVLRAFIETVRELGEGHRRRCGEPRPDHVTWGEVGPAVGPAAAASIPL